MIALTNAKAAGSRKSANGVVLRSLDISMAMLGILILAPVFAVVALSVRLGDRGPILFRQKRVGRNGELFEILKFRTMSIVYDGPAITAAGDARITPIGATLRRYKLDELPQLLCVLRGHMSLIGPRPEVPEFVELNDDLWQMVLQARPGITDLATLAFRNEEEILNPVVDANAYYRSAILPEKLRLNVRYQRSRSLVTDFKLLWLSARYSFFPRGFDKDRVVRSLGV